MRKKLSGLPIPRLTAAVILLLIGGMHFYALALLRGNLIRAPGNGSYIMLPRQWMTLLLMASILIGTLALVIVSAAILAQPFKNKSQAPLQDKETGNSPEDEKSELEELKKT